MKKYRIAGIVLIVGILFGFSCLVTGESLPMQSSDLAVAEVTQDTDMQDEEPDYEAMQKELDALRLAEKELEKQARAGAVSADEYEEQRAGLFSRLAGLMMRADRGTFRLDGVVVDEHGEPMEGVRMSVVRSRMTGFDRSVDRETEQQIDGSFSVRVSGYETVALIFKKAGYYQVIRDFPQLSAEEEDDLEEEFESGRVRPRRYVYPDIRVEMQSIGETARVSAIRYTTRLFETEGVTSR